jgi:hypothetical protein
MVVLRHQGFGAGQAVVKSNKQDNEIRPGFLRLIKLALCEQA